MRTLEPKGVAPPFSRYSHGVEIPAGHRQVHVSGQVGVKPDGTMAAGAEAQLEQAWANVMAVLAEAGMGPADIVKTTVLLVPGIELGLSRRVRDKHLAGALPASTLLYVAALARADFLCEVEAIAAKAA